MSRLTLSCSLRRPIPTYGFRKEELSIYPFPFRLEPHHDRSFGVPVLLTSNRLSHSLVGHFLPSSEEETQAISGAWSIAPVYHQPIIVRLLILEESLMGTNPT